jgi:hypothetical protein
MDSSYSALVLPRDLSDAHSVLFLGTDTLYDRIGRVDVLMPFVLDPEFDAYRTMMDTRSTVQSDSRPVGPTTIYEFYKKLSGNDAGFFKEYKSNQAVQSSFSHVGDVTFDSYVDDLKKRFSYGFETSRSFSAFVYVVLLKMNRLLKSTKRYGDA